MPGNWEKCDEANCIGVRLDCGKCLAHADETDRQAALAQITKTGKVDARGVTISEDLLARIRSAAPRGEQGEATFAEVDFGGATFEGRAQFGPATFTGVAWFVGATFTGPADFVADFLGATFSHNAFFSRVTFKGGARFRDATFTSFTDLDEANFIGDADFLRATFRAYAGFRGATFGAKAGFREATFTASAFFERASFTGLAVFYDATFTGDARFWLANFTGPGLFERASFAGEAHFQAATFTGDANFEEATFTGDAHFEEATFTGDAHLEDSVFAEIAWFDRATFVGAVFAGATFRADLRFVGAVFESAESIGPIPVHGNLYLDNASFRRPVVIEASAGGLRCRRTSFPAGVQFRLRRARVELDDADFSVPSILTGLPRLSDDKVAAAEQVSIEQWRRDGEEVPEKPRLVSLRRANVGGLALGNVSLAECRFAGAHNLDAMRLDGDITFGLSAARAGWERRQVIAEEAEWRAGRGGWTAPYWPDWAGDKPGPLDPGVIAGIYRALRKGREDAKDEPGAADFYYGEMEMRRHAAAPVGEQGAASRGRADRVVLTAYWLVSGYGLRAWRAFAAVGILAVIVTTLMTGVGLAASAPAQALRGVIVTGPSAGGTINGTLTTTAAQLPPPGRRWTADRAWTSVEVALDSFVFRETSQPLTVAGAWIADLARITGPLLLAFGLLALRNRVRR